jgi:hypothetical protein
LHRLLAQLASGAQLVTAAGVKIHLCHSVLEDLLCKPIVSSLEGYDPSEGSLHCDCIVVQSTLTCHVLSHLRLMQLLAIRQSSQSGQLAGY